MTYPHLNNVNTSMFPGTNQTRFSGLYSGRAQGFQFNLQQNNVRGTPHNVQNTQCVVPAWPPDHVLVNYNGPYPRRELQEARFSLIDSLLHDRSIILQRVKPKLGITSTCGFAYLPPPPPQPDDNQRWGTSSITSHSSCFPSSLYHGEYPETGSKISTRISGQNSQQGSQFVGKNNLSLVSVDSGFSEDASPLDSTVSSEILLTDSGGDVSVFDSPSATGSEWSDGSVKKHHRSFATGAVTSSGRTETVTSPEQLSVSDGDIRTAVMKRSLECADTTGAVKKCRLSTDPSPAGNRTGLVFQVYKCDLCTFKTENKEQLNKHLINAKHMSGSLYNTNGNELLSIEQMLVIKNEHSKTKSLIVACPDCREIFCDIFMCGMHHKYVHGSKNGCYSVCPITYHETIAFHVIPKCNTCKTEFERHRELHLHWTANPEHHPLKEPTNPQMFAIYICPYCSKIFYNNFLLCKTHVLGHQKTNKVLALEVKHVLQPMRREELLPFNTSPGHKDGLQMELTILLNLREFYRNDISGSNMKCKALKPRIRAIRQLLGSW